LAPAYLGDELVACNPSRAGKTSCLKYALANLVCDAQGGIWGGRWGVAVACSTVVHVSGNV
jgi:hypothetical protein